MKIRACSSHSRFVAREESVGASHAALLLRQQYRRQIPLRAETSLRALLHKFHATGDSGCSSHNYAAQPVLLKTSTRLLRQGEFRPASIRA
jgi:hypothetical protein